MAELKDLKGRFMKDPAFREEYERADEEYALEEAMVRARTAANLTQSQLAERLGLDGDGERWPEEFNDPASSRRVLRLED